MWTKSLLVPLIISIVINQCSGRSLWQAIKDIKNTIIFPDDVIDMRTNPPWPYCGLEGQEGNCRRKRDIEDGLEKSNLTEVIDNESIEKETSNLLQDEEINTDNLTITGNKTTENMLAENDNYTIDSVTSTENTQSITGTLLTTENITNLIENNIQTNNNCTIINENVTLSEKETQVLENFTIAIENITNNINNDNCTITTESKTISKTNTTQPIEEITNISQALATDEITTIITPAIRKEIQNSEDYKEVEINTSENILNVDQNSNTTVNINHQTNSTSETLFSENDSSFNYSPLEINEDGGNLTSTVLANVNNTNNENQTINLDTNLIENNLTSKQYTTINEIELEQNYNISIIYDGKNSVVYPNNLTLHEDINEDTFNSQLNDDNNTIINQNMLTLSEDITVSSISNEKENTITTTNIGVEKRNLTEVIDNESVEKETSNLLQDEEINTDNLTITGNKTTENILTENDNYTIDNVTSTENMTQSITGTLLTTENITNLIENNIQTNNNCTIINENVTSAEKETQVLENFTIAIENITNNINNDNCTITTESKTISKTNTTQPIEEITNNSQALATDEITTIITPAIRKEIQNSEDYKEIDIKTSENILNVDQNSKTTVNINHQTNSTSETLFSENDSTFNYSPLEINEDGGNLTSTVLANVNNTNNENQTINLDTNLIENNLTSKQYTTINETELEQNYNISIISDGKNSVVYPNNLTFHEDINEDMFNSQLNDDNNTIINQNMSTLSEDITVSSISNEKENTITTKNIENNLNFTNSFNVRDLKTSSEISGIDLFSNFTNVLNETGFNLTESENETVIFTNGGNESNINATPNKVNDELTESGREKREIVMNLTSPNLGKTIETYKAEEHLTNKTFSVDNATSIKTETTNKSTPVNDTVQSSAVKDTNVAMTTEKVCLIQGEACTNSTQCCENFECTMFDIIKWSSNCDFKPSDPQMATPLSDIRIPKQIIPRQISP